jgi:hypothetical protein
VSAEKPLDTYSFDIGQFAKGEPLQIAIAATDKSAGASARAIPFPIEAKGIGTCHIAVELGSAKGDTFAVSADGFAPNEDINLTSQSEGETIKQPAKAKDDGTWSIIWLPTVVGKDSGTDTITLAGQACSVSVQYAWGKDALKAQ